MVSLTPSVAKALALSACWRALSALRLSIRHRKRAGRSGHAFARGSVAQRPLRPRPIFGSLFNLVLARCTAVELSGATARLNF